MLLLSWVSTLFRLHRSAFIIAVLVPFFSAHAQFSLVEENDFFSLENNDEDYTQGLELRYDFGQRERVALGHTFYTPEDKRASSLIESDRPYAALLYAKYEKVVPFSWERLDRYGIQVGLVGPGAGGKEVQKLFHKLISSTDPQGWDNQLNNEVVFSTYYHRHGYAIEPGKYWDILYTYGIDAGTLRSSVSTSLTLRLSLLGELPLDYSPDPIHIKQTVKTSLESVSDTPASTAETSTRKGNTLFLFIQNKDAVVLNNIFLDGNTFQDSHSVEKEYLVSDINAGVYYEFSKWFASYVYTIRTREFEGQDSFHKFGSINIGKRL